MATGGWALPVLQLDIAGGSYDAGRGLVGSGDLFYRTFALDMSGLNAGTGIHFDLNNESIRFGDVDVAGFAPFSPDAEDVPGADTPEAVPEPGTLGLLGLGLSAPVFATRRRRKARTGTAPGISKPFRDDRRGSALPPFRFPAARRISGGTFRPSCASNTGTSERPRHSRAPRRVAGGLRPEAARPRARGGAASPAPTNRRRAPGPPCRRTLDPMPPGRPRG